MRMHEDFTRCTCGCAWIKKEEYMTGEYKKDSYMIPKGTSLIQYRCKECNTILHSETIVKEITP